MSRRTIAKALQHKTPDASILYHAGLICAKAGDNGTAKRHLYQALSLNPNFHPQQALVAADTLKTLSEVPVPKTSEKAGSAN